jgi:hypothetical protein
MVATCSHVNLRARLFTPAHMRSSLASAAKSLEITRRPGKIGVPVRSERPRMKRYQWETD